MLSSSEKSGQCRAIAHRESARRYPRPLISSANRAAKLSRATQSVYSWSHDVTVEPPPHVRGPDANESTAARRNDRLVDFGLGTEVRAREGGQDATAVIAPGSSCVVVS